MGMFDELHVEWAGVPFPKTWYPDVPIVFQTKGTPRQKIMPYVVDGDGVLYECDYKDGAIDRNTMRRFPFTGGLEGVCFHARRMELLSMAFQFRDGVIFSAEIVN